MGRCVGGVLPSALQPALLLLPSVAAPAAPDSSPLPQEAGEVEAGKPLAEVGLAAAIGALGAWRSSCARSAPTAALGGSGSGCGCSCSAAGLPAGSLRQGRG